jgi:hypothetical protein
MWPDRLHHPTDQTISLLPLDTCQTRIQYVPAADYAGVIEGMRFGKVHIAWFGNKSAMEASVEAIDPRPVEGIRATGSNVLEDIFYGVIPPVLPLWISYSLYRFEANVRSASAVGMVGASGIGMLLWDAIRGFQYGATAAMLIVIIVTVSLVDLGSSRLRKAFIWESSELSVYLQLLWMPEVYNRGWCFS